MKSKFLLSLIACGFMMGGANAAQRCANLEDFGDVFHYAADGNNVTRLIRGIVNSEGLLSIRTTLIDEFVNSPGQLLEQDEIDDVRAIRVFGHIFQVYNFIRYHNFAPNTPITYIGADGLPYRTTVMDVRNNSLRIFP